MREHHTTTILTQKATQTHASNSPIPHTPHVPLPSDADALYGRLWPTLLEAVERLAASGEAKYAPRLRLENYSAASATLSALAPAVPALVPHAGVAEARRGAALRGYVLSCLQASKLWRLLELGERLEGLLKVCGDRGCAAGGFVGNVDGAPSTSHQGLYR